MSAIFARSDGTAMQVVTGSPEPQCRRLPGLPAKPAQTPVRGMSHGAACNHGCPVGLPGDRNMGAGEPTPRPALASPWCVTTAEAVPINRANSFLTGPQLSGRPATVSQRVPALRRRAGAFFRTRTSPGGSAIFLLPVRPRSALRRRMCHRPFWSGQTLRQPPIPSWQPVSDLIYTPATSAERERAMARSIHSFALRPRRDFVTDLATVCRSATRPWAALTAGCSATYRPERHYMRGPGPKWREKHGHLDARASDDGPVTAALLSRS